MPGFTCCVPGCYNNSHRDRELRFYTFPKDPAQREIWLKNISRAGVSGCFSTFQPTTGHRVCSVHFTGGRKTYNVRVPTLFPLRGVNERKNRRGRGRGRKVSAVPPPPAGAATAAAAVPTGIVFANVVSAAGEAVEGGASAAANLTVVQIDQNGEYIVPANPADRTYYGAATGSADQPGHPTSEPQTVQYLSVISSPLDHSYSLTTGTTSAELLRKLNEQRDIIALMEVKMKEMKATIRQLRVTEAKLQEEVRERDRLLAGPAAAFTARKKV
ncbi:THAP domain-containing protein 11 [Lampris incognitus]|uniref:THAP domain-containing protein 11 n=1 Tax=Lampris incognitus TaxID=2546036 RepID=UPI0024B5116A|nr:THAP domain-containing protein 11 [Lampris incognitus]